MAISGENQIKSYILLDVQASDPTGIPSGKVAIYAKDVSGSLEFFTRGRDGSGDTAAVQITDDGNPVGGVGGGGAEILFGSGVPSNGLGADGDAYIDNSAGALYSKSAGTWSLEVSLKGADGSDGSNGAPGADGSDGSDGIFSAIATQGEAEAGTESTKGMTPERTAQAIAALAGSGGGDLLASNNLSDVANMTTALTNLGGLASSHTISHAPSDAQKNSDITKAEIESSLTGEISSHSHAGGGGGATFYEIVLGPGADLATRLASLDTSAPAGWTISQASLSGVSNIHTGADDLMVEHTTSGIPATVLVWQGKSSGPVQRLDLIEFDAAASIKSKLDFSAFSLADIPTPSDATFHIKIIVQMLTTVSFP